MTLEPMEAMALAAAAMIGAIEQGQPTPEAMDEADRLRHDAVGLVNFTGLTPMQVVELAKRVAREAGEQ